MTVENHSADRQPSQGDAPVSTNVRAVVGIGASAGGLKALRAFFATVPPDSGLAYAVVVHLPPSGESHLASLLQPHAGIPVEQVTDMTRLEPNRAYVIPPGRNLNSIDSHLRLTPIETEHRAPIDHFFRTLANTFDGSSIGVILSGTGTDGAEGVRNIREQGGLVLVQDPREAEYDGMPRNAINTGLVDIVAPVADIQRHILAFVRTNPRVPPPTETENAEPERQDHLHKALALVRLRTGHDFLRYKRSTVARRLARRMQILGVEQLSAYVEILRNTPDEALALLDDLLINVTTFFRDAEVFQALEKDVIPKIFEGKGPRDRVRVWSVGCSTGEEAYSIGMLLLEEAARRVKAPQVQLFASDLHERSLRLAREGHYPTAIEEHVSAERLERFFRREDGIYRVSKALRDVVVFAAHNLLQDPPFSRLDLIVCRNVLIYLRSDAQRDVIELFHYALRGEGYLLLGTAETLDRADLFHLENSERHLYQRREVPGGKVRLPRYPLPSPSAPQPPGADAAPRAPAGPSYGAVHQSMLDLYAPPSLLVDNEHNVVHFSEHAGRYLQHPGGLPTTNVFQLVREELRVELRAALHAAQEGPGTNRSRPIPVSIDGVTKYVVLRVKPAGKQESERWALVIFDELDEPADAAVPGPQPATGDAVVRNLEAELDVTRTRFQKILEEYEESQEEMRASNEELQSANEELRSTMEELETSREELQSTNEELQTLNQEHKHKVDELSQLSNDLQNLLQASDVATVFLDRNLRILRFTPRVGEIFSVRHSDRGRPLEDLTHRLSYTGLIDDARRVLQTLVPVEREVESQDRSRWYVVRITPYRTMDDRIEGVVITIVDVSILKRSEKALHESEQRERVAASRDALHVSLASAEEDERRRISRELHDEVGQHVTALGLGLQALSDVAPPDSEIDRRATELRRLVDTMGRELHEIAVRLRPKALDDFGLEKALGAYAEEWSRQSGIEIALHVRPEAERLPAAVESAVYRVVQEALTNVAKHGEAKRVGVVVERRDGQVHAIVEDDGKGFDQTSVPARRPKGKSKVVPGLGLLGIRERVELLGGTLEIESTPRRGTTLFARIPLDGNGSEQAGQPAAAKPPERSDG